MTYKTLGYWFILPALLAVLSLGALGVWGLKPGTELAGGSLLQVSYPDGRPTQEQLHEAVAPLALGEVRIQPSGESDYILRQRDLSVEEKAVLMQALGAHRTAQEVQYTSIGPSIGQEVLRKGLIAFGLVVVCILLFIAFAFRKVSEPVQSWKYGVVTVLTLLFDVLVPVGMFAALGHYAGAEMDSLFIVALLAILGISINDKIVVFDRIRENLLKAEGRKAFADVVWASTKQTLARSINTSLTVVIVLGALYVLGPVSTQNFSLVLMVGIIVGTYSSLCFASPLLVLWERYSRKD